MPQIVIDMSRPNTAVNALSSLGQGIGEVGAAAGEFARFKIADEQRKFENLLAERRADQQDRSLDLAEDRNDISRDRLDLSEQQLRLNETRLEASIDQFEDRHEIDLLNAENRSETQRVLNEGRRLENDVNRAAIKQGPLLIGAQIADLREIDPEAADQFEQELGVALQAGMPEGSEDPSDAILSPALGAQIQGKIMLAQQSALARNRAESLFMQAYPEVAQTMSQQDQLAASADDGQGGEAASPEQQMPIPPEMLQQLESYQNALSNASSLQEINEIEDRIESELRDVMAVRQNALTRQENAVVGKQLIEGFKQRVGRERWGDIDFEMAAASADLLRTPTANSEVERRANDLFFKRVGEIIGGERSTKDQRANRVVESQGFTTAEDFAEADREQSGEVPAPDANDPAGGIRSHIARVAAQDGGIQTRHRRNWLIELKGLGYSRDEAIRFLKAEEAKVKDD